MNVNKIRLFPSHGLYKVLHQSGDIFSYSGDVSGQAIDSNTVRALLSLNPYSPKKITVAGTSVVSFYLPVGELQNVDDWNINYFGILGHNFEDVGGVDVKLSFHDGESSETISLQESDAMLNSKINSDNSFSSVNSSADELASGAGACNGTSMVYCDYKPTTACGVLKVEITPTSTYSRDLEIGSIVYGRYYEMPVSPDLSYKIGFMNDGVKSRKTLGGSDMVDVSFMRNPGFLGKYVPFSPGKEQDYESPAGRRTWDLNFSALKADFQTSPSDAKGYLFPEEYDSYTEYARGNDFYNRFMKPTLGGQLQFLFQFNTDERSSDDYYSSNEDYPLGVDKPPKPSKHQHYFPLFPLCFSLNLSNNKHNVNNFYYFYN